MVQPGFYMGGVWDPGQEWCFGSGVGHTYPTYQLLFKEKRQTVRLGKDVVVSLRYC